MAIEFVLAWWVTSILMFGVLSALKVSAHDTRIPGYPWLLLCRFGVGFVLCRVFATQGVWHLVDSDCHVVDCGHYVLCCSGYCSAGDMALELALISWVSCDPSSYGFSFISICQSLPCFILTGKEEKASERIAKLNYKKLPCGRLVLQEDKVVSIGSSIDTANSRQEPA